MSLRHHQLLSAEDQRTAGLPEPSPVAMADRVHHDELDALGHVNNTVYFKWFERLRVHFAAFYGIGVLTDRNAPRTIIRSAEIRYVEEMFAGEDYIVTTRCVAFRRTSYTLAQQIWASGRLRADFTCVMVLLTSHGRDRVPIPDPVRAKLAAAGARAQSSPA